MNDLFPKPKRRMLQPTKDTLRARIVDLERALVGERERAAEAVAAAQAAAGELPRPIAPGDIVNLPPTVSADAARRLTAAELQRAMGMPLPKPIPFAPTRMEIVREGNPISALLAHVARLFRALFNHEMPPP